MPCTLKIVIVGAGGHGQVIADILSKLNGKGDALEPIGYVDDNSSLKNCFLNNLPVLGKTKDLGRIEHDAVVVAIGDNQRRKVIYEKLSEDGERFSIICHPYAVISPNVIIGNGSQIIAGAVINTGTIIGKNSIINTGCTVDHHNIIGDHVHIAPGVHLGGSVIVEEGAFIGIGSSIAPRCRIGKSCIIGAGSVVLHDVPEKEKVYGTPARARTKTSCTGKKK
jgi:sugar O-acyltransferase (sialic acid O-acetyltransferase NeuD family)